MSTKTITAREVARTIEDLESQMAINMDLLTAVAIYIENHSNEFDMNEWGTDGRTFWQKVMCEPAFTVGCVACHTIRLGGGDLDGGNIPSRAQRLLNLTDEQAQSVFYVDSWPEPYRSQFYRASPKDSEGLAWITGQRLRKFIASNGAV